MYRGPIQWGQHNVCTSYATCGYHIHTHHGKHYTCLNMVHTIHTHIQTHVHCMQGVNLFSAHTLAFSSIELLVCMFKRTLILFSISVWDRAFVLVMCCSLLFYIIDNFCMWSYFVTGSLYIHESCNMRLTTPCETMLSQFFKNLANRSFCLLLHLQ